MRFKITLPQGSQVVETSWPVHQGERFLVAHVTDAAKGTLSSATSVQYHNHLGVLIFQEQTRPGGLVVERMVRVRHRTCQWSPETGETSVHAEIVTHRIGCLRAQIGYDLPTNGQGEQRAREKAKKQVIRSQMTGKVLQVLVAPGDLVTPETPLVVIEAMKMENRVFAARPGKVTSIACKAGDLIQNGRELLVVEAP